MFDFQEELRKLPDQPGVYIMHDKTDAIIYIGKAVSLRKRVRQYFQPSHDEGIKKKQMVVLFAARNVSKIPAAAPRIIPVISIFFAFRFTLAIFLLTPFVF